MKTATKIALCTIFALATAVHLFAQSARESAGRNDSREAQPMGEFVVVMDKAGGFRSRAGTSAHLLIVRPGGMAEVSGRETVHLGSDRLQALMNTIVDDLRFPSIDGERVAAQIENAASAANQLAHAVDAPVTTINIRWQDVEHRVQAYGIFVYARQFSDLDELQRLALVERKLDWVIAWVQAGGEMPVNSALERANAALKNEGAGTPVLTEQDLLAAVPGIQDGLTLQFAREENQIRWDVWVPPNPLPVEVKPTLLQKPPAEPAGFR